MSVNTNTSLAESPTIDASFSRLLLLSVSAALVWAALGFSRGATWGEYIALFAGAAVSLLLIQMALDAARLQAGAAARVLMVCGLAAVPIGFAGYWLALNTNHRPLAAVTFAASALAAPLGVAALVSPLKIAKKPAYGVAVVVGLVLLWPLLAGNFGVLPVVDVGSGIVLSALVARGARGKPVIRKLHWGAGVASALVLAAAVFALTAEEGAAAAVKAPILAGIVGLLS